jgi:CheY-like chemotaxis protein
VRDHPGHDEDHPSRLALRVLVADDEANVRSALRLLLEQEPIACQVSEAASAECLLRCALVAQPDVVLLDWDLPGLHAPSLLPALRDACPWLAVIALSGRPEERREALAAGADAFVSKVDAPEELQTALLRLGRARTPRP